MLCSFLSILDVVRPVIEANIKICFGIRKYASSEGLVG